tara:strand:+ start:597 stop:767 length:171 start_codon:yes stop_codon:yes gene_type:complete
MNIIELKKLIKELKQNPKDNKELIVFYEGKAKELIKEINQKIRQKLKHIDLIQELF